MSDGPRPYVGQPQQYESDEFNLWHDNAKPDQAPGRQDPADALDPDRPPGSQNVAPFKKKRDKKVRWYRNEDRK